MWLGELKGEVTPDRKLQNPLPLAQFLEKNKGKDFEVLLEKTGTFNEDGTPKMQKVAQFRLEKEIYLAREEDLVGLRQGVDNYLDLHYPTSSYWTALDEELGRIEDGFRNMVAQAVLFKI